MPDSAEVAPCRLCSTQAPLQRSHIIPRWAYRRVVALGNEPPVQIGNGVAMLSGSQDVELLLCSACEQRFGIVENYISRIVVQEDGAFPALDATTLVPGRQDAELRVATAQSLDRDAIARFAAMVIWRASESSLYPNLSLGDVYAQRFADYLLGRSPFPSQTRLVVELLMPSEPRIDRAVIKPESAREPAGYRLHQFVVFGLWFRLFVGGRSSEPLASISFVETGLVLLSDGERLRESMSASARSAIRRGRLANS